MVSQMTYEQASKMRAFRYTPNLKAELHALNGAVLSTVVWGYSSPKVHDVLYRTIINFEN